MTSIPSERFTTSAVQAAAMFGPEGIDREAWQPMAAAVLLSERDRVALVPPENGRGAVLPITPVPLPEATRRQPYAVHTANHLGALMRTMWMGHLQSRSVLSITGVLKPNGDVFTQPLNDPTERLQLLVPFAIKVKGQPQLQAGTWHNLDGAARQVGGSLGQITAFRGILQYLVQHPDSYRS
jgi:hypothetical protein